MNDDNKQQAGVSRVNPRALLALHLLLVVYSFAGVVSKIAASHDFMSVGFLAFYVLTVGILGVYAIGWQQVIKRMPLTTAYANRAITVVWSNIWGILLFHEQITWQKLLGALIVLIGVTLYATAPEGDGHDA